MLLSSSLSFASTTAAEGAAGHRKVTRQREINARNDIGVACTRLAATIPCLSTAPAQSPSPPPASPEAPRSPASSGAAALACVRAPEHRAAAQIEEKRG